MKPRWVLFACAASAACASRAPVPARAVFPIASVWTVSMGEDPIQGPLASDGGRVFVATRGGQVSGLDRFTGATLWQVAGRSGALALGGGLLALRAEDGAVWAMSPEDGAAQWKAESGVAGTFPPVLGGGHIVIAGEGLAVLEAATGRVVWSDMDAKAATAPALTTTAVVLGEADGHLRSRDLATGRVQWSLATTGPLQAAPVADDRGRILVGTTDRRFLSIDGENGKERWTWRLGADVQHRAVLFERLVLFATHEDVLYALDRGNGHLAWRAPLPSRPLSGPILFGDAVVVACHGARPGETFLIGFSARSGERQGDYKVPGEARTPPLLVEDRVYLALRDRAHSVVSLHLGAAEASTP
ncbi:MAG TPA: PQQ-binding-like beta-propeller repeat protein [Vicinamibacteria bacterium]|nr:PQQ-binding-like beta-propeller repeat protein [Vicinamibacteria bacterium]